MNKTLRLLIGISIFFFVSCSKDKTERRNVICLIDYSNTIKQETLKDYASIIAKDIFLSLGPKDKFIVMPIDEGAKTQNIFLVYEDLKNKNFDKEINTVIHKQDTINSRFNHYLSSKSDSTYIQIIEQKELRKEFNKKTDIINAIELVPTWLEKTGTDSSPYDNQDKTEYHVTNILIICSDMIQESQEFNFKKNSQLTRKKVDETIQKLKNDKRIPNLENVVVFVNGRTGKNNKQVDDIKYFWESYFRETKADLRSYDYDCRHTIKNYLNGE